MIVRKGSRQWYNNVGSITQDYKVESQKYGANNGFQVGKLIQMSLKSNVTGANETKEGQIWDNIGKEPILQLKIVSVLLDLSWELT